MKRHLYSNCQWFYMKKKVLTRATKKWFQIFVFMGAWLQSLLLYFLPKSCCLPIAVKNKKQKKKHVNLYLKHEYDAPYAYNKLSCFVSYSLGSLLSKTSSQWIRELSRNICGIQSISQNILMDFNNVMLTLKQSNTFYICMNSPWQVIKIYLIKRKEKRETWRLDIYNEIKIKIKMMKISDEKEILHGICGWANKFYKNNVSK